MRRAMRSRCRVARAHVYATRDGRFPCPAYEWATHAHGFIAHDMMTVSVEGFISALENWRPGCKRRFTICLILLSKSRSIVSLKFYFPIPFISLCPFIAIISPVSGRMLLRHGLLRTLVTRRMFVNVFFLCVNFLCKELVLVVRYR